MSQRADDGHSIDVFRFLSNERQLKGRHLKVLWTAIERVAACADARYAFVRNDELLSLLRVLNAVCECMSERQMKRLATKLETLIRLWFAERHHAAMARQIALLLRFLADEGHLAIEHVQRL